MERILAAMYKAPNDIKKQAAHWIVKGYDGYKTVIENRYEITGIHKKLSYNEFIDYVNTNNYIRVF